MMRILVRSAVRASGFLLVVLQVLALAGCGRGTTTGVTDAQPTFDRDIAPIVFNHCAACHNNDGSAPFPLLTYAEVRNRGPQIAQVTKSHFMPPWLPRGGDYTFSGDCSLNTQQIAKIHDWVAAGSLEGNAVDLPPAPQGPLRGKPDLVVEMPHAYMLQPEGTDVWRKFVIPVPLASARYVRAVDIRPSNPKVVHHAVVHIDTTGKIRALAAKNPDNAIDGMTTYPEERNPPGHFVNWLPGKIPFADDPAMAWRIEPGTDLVVEAHMLPSGKPEPVRISIGFYFTDTPPSKFPVDFLLHSESIDIPAGSQDFEAADSYQIPQDVQLLGLYPHCHLLGKTVDVWAIFPGGTKKTLLRIPRWDFNWQNAYRLSPPVLLPRGTTVAMRIRYDNSAENVRNPFNPPRRVQFGYHTDDEMAQVNVDVLPQSAAAANEFLVDFRRHDILGMIKSYQFTLTLHPDDVVTHVELGKDLAVTGHVNEGIESLRRAVELDPGNAEAHYYLGRFEATLSKPAIARLEFEKAIHADPNYYLAVSELGLWHMQNGNLDQAAELLERSLKLHPRDAVVLNNLGIVRFRQDNRGEALRCFKQAVAVAPDYRPAVDNLRQVEAAAGN